jgi:nucleotide-binding universal stress UspA family protein
MTDPYDYHGAIVVGLGDAADAWPELDWAAREASLRKRPLRVLRAFQISPSLWPWDTSTERMINDELHAAAGRRIKTALEHVAEQYPQVQVRGRTIEGDPRVVLRGAAETAEMVVVGSRRMNALGCAVLGSVSATVAGAESGTVVVVGAPGGLEGEQPAVVAGIDGSPVGEDVLGFAFDFASRHGRALRVVYCWPPDRLAEMEWRMAPPAPDRADRWLAESLAGWQAKYPDVDLHRAVVRDHAVSGLVRESASQELLVVGAHARRGRFASWLGSVSQGVLHHATCPVAVVHPAAE